MNRDSLFDNEPPWLTRLTWAAMIFALLYFGQAILEFNGYFRLRY